jgi:anthranilate synthase component I
MIITPDYDSFARAYERGEPQILSTRLVADLETPVSAKLKLARNARYSFLLESVEGGAVRGRYSIIGLNPDLIWKVEGGKAFLNRKAGTSPQGPFEETGPAAAPVAPRAAGGKPHQAARGCATHGRGRLRLHGL